MNYKRIKGFADLISPDVDKYAKMEEKAKEVFFKYGFQEIRTPILEPTELYLRSIGQETDIVQKEMYTFLDRRGRSLTLRPEATAGVVRAYIENRLFEKRKVMKLFSIGPMFRYERPQKGRYRQFHQINVECFGAKSYVADGEIILMLMEFLSSIGIKDVELRINSLGCENCRRLYLEKLKEFLKGISDDALCSDCIRRREKNPLRVFDCKNEKCQKELEQAPFICDFLCDNCKDHFEKLLNFLDKSSLSYKIDKKLVRGLDYYTKTIFEVVSQKIGAQSSIAGGGRYDYLVKMLGGPDTPAIGFACGMERLSLIMSEVEKKVTDVYILVLSEIGTFEAMNLAKVLRTHGLCVEVDAEGRSIKSSLREANRIGAKVSVFVGEDEVKEGRFTIKDMKLGKQYKLGFDETINLIKEVAYGRDKSN